MQRWRDGRQSWRRRRDGGFDPSRYQLAHVAGSEARTVRAFVLANHYAPTLPSGRLYYAMTDLATGNLVGAVILGIPTHPAVLTRPFPTLEPYTESLEISRVCLLDDVAANGESWACGRMFDHARQVGVRGLVAHSDPTAYQRTTPAGKLITTPGHIGTIYQAGNAVYSGQTRARRAIRLPDGTTLHERAVSKLLAGHRGGAGVAARLAAYPGATAYAGGDPAAWLRATLAAIGAVDAATAGKHRYLFDLNPGRRRRRTVIALPARPYPKRDQQSHQLGLLTALDQHRQENPS